MGSKNAAVVKHATHEIPPLVFADSEILILGSFPSVKSRQSLFYYGHPQNRFWAVLSGVFCESKPVSVEEKTALCKRHHIALYDSLEECDIVGSSDSSIVNPVPADLAYFYQRAPIKKILINGKKAAEMFDKYQKAPEGVEIIVLSSTSPANAIKSLSDLLVEWGKALKE